MSTKKLKINKHFQTMLDSIGVRISEIINKTASLNQSKLAKAVNVDRSYVSNWIGNKSTPSTRAIFEISQVLKCNPAWLLTGENSVYDLQQSQKYDLLSDTGNQPSDSEREAMNHYVAQLHAIMNFGDDELRSQAEKLMSEVLIQLNTPGEKITKVRSSK